MSKVIVSYSVSAVERIEKLKEQLKVLDKAHTAKVKTLETVHKDKRKVLLSKLKEAGWKPPVKKALATVPSSTSTEIKDIAKQQKLKVELLDEILTVFFPKVTYSETGAKVTPVLTSDDRGKTWAPDFDLGDEPGWVGKLGLSGKSLIMEVNRMFKVLSGSSKPMLDFIEALPKK